VRRFRASAVGWPVHPLGQMSGSGNPYYTVSNIKKAGQGRGWVRPALHLVKEMKVEARLLAQGEAGCAAKVGYAILVFVMK